MNEDIIKTVTVRLFDEIKDTIAIFNMMLLEKDWIDYCGNDAKIGAYNKALVNDIVYVVYEDNKLCGFLRAKDDNGFGMYIWDLLVHKDYRGKNYGKQLIDQACKDYSGTVYVMSDVDNYYSAQGYNEIAGRIIIVRK